MAKQAEHTHLVDALMLLDMYIAQNPGTMLPAVRAHVKAAEAFYRSEIDARDKAIAALADQLEEATSEDAEVVFELDTEDDDEPN